MYNTVLNKYAIRQIAYVVDDLEQGCRDFSALFGAGPFVGILATKMASAKEGDKEVEICLDQAYAAFGDMQIELIEVPKTGDISIFNKTGLHHYSIWADDIDEALADFAAAGFYPALTMTSGQGLVINFIDCTEKWGHYIELYTPQEGLDKMVKGLAQNWDGENPYMSISDVKRG